MGQRFQVTAGAAIFYPVLYFFDSTGWFSALVPAVLAHEVGHLLALHGSGASVQCLRLEVSGLCMECTELFSPRSEALCAGAGPAAGLLWALIMGFVPGRWAQMSMELSMGLSIFNLLPVLPLDGGRIILALTGRENVVRMCGWLTPVVISALAFLLRQWSLLVPAGIVLLCQFKA